MNRRIKQQQQQRQQQQHTEGTKEINKHQQHQQHADTTGGTTAGQGQNTRRKGEETDTTEHQRGKTHTRKEGEN